MRAETEKKLNDVKKLIVEGMTVEEACAKAGVSIATYYNNKSRIKNMPQAKTMISTPENSFMIEKLKAENAALRRFIKDFL